MQLVEATRELGCMRILTFTSLYPDASRPRHGIFVEHRVRQLAAQEDANISVVAPVPWVPAAWPLFGRYSVLAKVPTAETRHGISIQHPRFVAVPKLSGWLNPVSMALGALPSIRRLWRQGGEFDLIDAHFLYPDGAAAALLGAWLGKPFVVTARGTDANLFTTYRVPRAWIRWMARRAAALITVSAALRMALLRLEIPPERVIVLRNGVDLELFRPQQRDAVRSELGLRGSTLLSVGHLLADKGHHLVIEALRQLPAVDLVIIGEGPKREKLQALARELGVADRIKWTGTISQPEIVKYYSAADATILASRSEGMPNVVLESLACGTPVIATTVGGIPEVLDAPVAGILMKSRSAAAVVDAYRALMRCRPEVEAVRRHAERFDWGSTTQGQLQLFRSILSGSDVLTRVGEDLTAMRRHP